MKPEQNAVQCISYTAWNTRQRAAHNASYTHFPNWAQRAVPPWPHGQLRSADARHISFRGEPKYNTDYARRSPRAAEPGGRVRQRPHEARGKFWEKTNARRFGTCEPG